MISRRALLKLVGILAAGAAVAPAVPASTAPVDQPADKPKGQAGFVIGTVGGRPVYLPYWTEQPK